ncbi:MAG: class IV adenylate cyclase [Leptospiraceae bacterium]|nr:class IV adenylate cyclase [Leptospiraceae bacterium]MDW8307160.1 class IV adenylate cyclase [Leptospiraceae bacterium]
MKSQAKFETEIKLVISREHKTISKTCDPGSLETLLLPDVLTKFFEEYSPKIFIAQKDDYFDHPAFKLRQNDLVLRKRQNIVFVRKKKLWLLQNHEEYLTYKGKSQVLDNAKSRFEIEARANQEIFEILDQLGFIAKCEINKHRWISKAGDYTISLDVVEYLGIFLEVELMSEAQNQKDAFRKLAKFLQAHRLDVFERESRSYAELLCQDT